MSGVFCFVDYNKYYNQLDVENLLPSIYQHSLYTYEDQNFSFSSLLSCEDTREGKLLDLDDIAILFDGLLYSKDKKYESLSDIEILQIEYASIGSKLFQKLDGVFSLIIYDKKLQKIYIAKDRVGVKPLYFYQKDNTLIFGSSLKYFFNTKFFEKELDKDSLAIYLQYGYIIQPNTIFKNTYKIKSGHFLEFDLKTQDLQEQKYWSLEECYLEEKVHFSESEIITDIHHLLKQSIQKRVDEGLSMGSSLSGGYDSSMIAALLQERSEKKVDTFTIGFDDKSINEAPFAKEIASYLGTYHTEHYFSAKDALRIIPTLCQVYDEPFADYGATPTLLTSQIAKESGVDLLFVGDGGDEVFATADDINKFETILSLPKNMRNLIYKSLSSIDLTKMPYLKDHGNIPTKYYKLLNIFNATDIPDMVRLKTILFTEHDMKYLIKDHDVSFETTFDEMDFSGSSESVDQVIGAYFKTFMTDGELVKSYGAINGANMSLREPFLDRDLIAYMAKVPSSIKIKNDIKKYLLKEIAYQYIPKELLDRPKSGFNIPFASWLRGELKEILYAQVNEKRLKEDDIFDPNYILDIRDQFYSGKDEYKYKIWTIFLFQLWFEENFLKV